MVYLKTSGSPRKTVPYFAHSIPFRRLTSGNEVHTEKTKNKQADRKISTEKYDKYTENTKHAVKAIKTENETVSQLKIKTTNKGWKT